MTHKDELIKRINQFNKIHAHKLDNPVLLTYVSEKKPTNYFYYMPDINIFSQKDEHCSWFVEIYANDKCLFRESMTNKEEYHLERYEEPLCAIILLNSFIRSVFTLLPEK
jgi:hypothetical protein